VGVGLLGSTEAAHNAEHYRSERLLACFVARITQVQWVLLQIRWPKTLAYSPERLVQLAGSFEIENPVSIETVVSAPKLSYSLPWRNRRGTTDFLVGVEFAFSSARFSLSRSD
jgi:hypothetical protein